MLPTGLVLPAGSIHLLRSITACPSWYWPAPAQTRDSVTMRKSARTLFNYSLSYLFIVFFAFMTDNPWRVSRGSAHECSRTEIRSVEVESPEVAADRARVRRRRSIALGIALARFCRRDLLCADHRQDGPGSV